MPEQEKVLVADDSRGIRDFLIQYILKPKGFKVITATNDRDGLDLARKHSSPYKRTFSIMSFRFF